MNNDSIDYTETTTTQEGNDLKNTNVEEVDGLEASLNNGSVIMISRENSKEDEVYNIATLDKFIPGRPS